MNINQQKQKLFMKIRKIKKAINKSNGFFTVVMNNGICFCVSEWYTRKLHKHKICINSVYIPYKEIKKLIING